MSYYTDHGEVLYQIRLNVSDDFTDNDVLNELLENYNYFIESIKKEKPDTIKGDFIKSTYLTSTMGIAYKIGTK